MEGQPFDTFVVTDPWNRGWLSGFWSHDEIDERAGYLFISKDKAAIMTDFRYEERVKDEALGFEVFIWTKLLQDHLPKVWEYMDSEVVAFDKQFTTFLEYEQMASTMQIYRPKSIMYPVNDFVEKLRIIRSEDDIEKVKRAIRISEDVLHKVNNLLRPGLTETDIVHLCNHWHREYGADDISFPPLVAIGENISKPHNLPGSRKLQEGDPVLIDIGCKKDWYCSDITRTFFLGEPSDRMKEVYKTAKRAWEIGLESIRAGITWAEADAPSRKYITEADPQFDYRHAMGHGLGLKVHEPPNLNPNRTEDYLEENMIVTCEPGVYVPTVGGARIESVVVVTENGCERLDQIDLTYNF
jgi:Xaa-Pro aminopeptidase